MKLSDAYFAEARVSGATTRSGPAVASSVYPSGAAFNTFIAAMEPFAPGMFSITRVCPRARCRTGVDGRTEASTPNPAG
ncbi:hypothetical protein GmRootV59_62270 (plasmid) [Variovorax sp. V59]